MFSLIRLVFWIAVLGSLIYFSGDIKFKNKSLKTWAATLWVEGDTAKKKLEADPDVINTIKRFISQDQDQGLSEKQLKEIQNLIDERLTQADRQSMNQLMKTLSTSPSKSKSTTPPVTKKSATQSPEKSKAPSPSTTSH